jgi:hypothetical protein
MGLIAKNSGGDIEPLRADTHHGICYSVIDIGTQPSNNPKFRAKRKVVITWEIPHERIDLERDGQIKNLPRAISRTLTLSLSPKSNMRPMLEAWRGRAFTETELDGFELKNLLGANALLGVIHERKADKTYANIASVAKLMASMQKMKGELPQVYYALDDQKGKFSIPPNIPDWIKAMIMQSQEWGERMNDAGHQAAPPSGQREDNTSDEPVDDVPF